MASGALKTLRLALIQISVTSNKASNLKHARKMISEAAVAVTAKHEQQQSSKGVPLVVLPECFNSPYGTQYFADYAEEIPGETTAMLSEAARSEGVYLIGGSIPERRGDKLYNTTTAFNPNGDMILKYSKLHLFDIDVPGKIRFQESEVLTAGDNLGIFDISPHIRIGLGICYDMRFAELSMVLAREGCNVLIFPGAFNLTTGEAHWELIQRARAIDNEVYVATCSPARDMQATYNAWGYSMVVDPWASIIATADETEQIVYADLDMNRVSEVRQQVPIHYQRREDLYKLDKKT